MADRARTYDTKKVTLVRRHPAPGRPSRALPWPPPTLALTIAVAMTAAFAATSVGFLIAVADQKATTGLAARP